MNVANIFFLKAPVLSCFATGNTGVIQVDQLRLFSIQASISPDRLLFMKATVCLNQPKLWPTEVQTWAKLSKKSSREKQVDLLLVNSD